MQRPSFDVQNVGAKTTQLEFATLECDLLPMTDPTESPDAPTIDGVDEMEPVMVTMTFQTSQPDALLAVLSKYVVLCRGASGCRNVDLVASMTKPGRLVIVQKWESTAHQTEHFDSPVMVDMATACTGLLTEPPDIDLYEAVTMHDLK